MQAYLISQLVYGEAPEFWNHHNLKFITSELRIEHNGKKVVNDILAIDSNGALWVIELKYKRKLDELLKQCEAFTKVIKENKELFKKLTTVLIKGTNWDGTTINKMIIWPAITGRRRAKTLKLIKDNNIVAVAYNKEYDFVPES